MSTIEATEAETLSFPVAGMTCQACAHSVEDALLSVPGVTSAEVNFGSRSARVQRDPNQVRGADLRRAIVGAGYGVPEDVGEGTEDLRRDLEFSRRAEERELLELRVDALAAGAFGVLAIVSAHLAVPAWIPLVAATVVVLGAGRKILMSGLEAARRGSPDMNTLVGLGALAAWAGAFAAPIAPTALGPQAPHIHAAVLILAFVQLGRWLEGRARAHAGGAVRALFELTPPTARLLPPDGEREEIEVPLEDVRPGDHVVIRPGDRIPVDGEVLEGRSSVDEARLTGESAPVERGPGDRVHAGTLNGTGTLSVHAIGIGEDSALGRIAAAVHAAQGSRARVQRLADRVSVVFVPIVIALALVTVAVWLLADASPDVILARFVAILVVACPCALGLATPTAVLTATDRAAREGALFRNADAFESLAAVDTLGLDKTGTLTTGEQTLTRIVMTGPARVEDDVLALAASVERASEQPLERAILRAAKQRQLPLHEVEGFRAHPGRGMRGRIRGLEVRLFGSHVAEEEGLVIGERLLSPFQGAGETPIFCTIEGELVCVLGLADTLRTESEPAIRALQALGVEVHLLSSDPPAVVQAAAKRLGIAHFRASMSPEEKAEYLQELAAYGRQPAMVGDGIDDALALTLARVGIAMGGGADVAIESADAALLRDDPSRLPLIVRLARRTQATIKTNLTWAFAYNVVALPLAAGVLAPFTGWSLPPQWGAAAMAGSSLFVVLNGLRLRWTSLEG